MFDRVVARTAELRRRVRRIERRELSAFRHWIEETNNLVHLSVLLFVPLLIALVTQLTNLTGLSFLLFPPLASGTYTLFADPRGKYADPRRFVGGLAVGGVGGWLAQFVAGALGGSGATTVTPLSAALAILLAGAATWALDAEEPAAYSTALLVLAADANRTAVTVFGQTIGQSTAYVVGVVASGSVVAAVFSVWRREVYERRAQYLYGTIRGDDHVLVPMRGETAETTALFGARLAAAHEAGKVVLLDVVDDDRVAAAEEAVIAERADEGVRVEDRTAEISAEEIEDEAVRRAAAEAADGLESYAATIRERAAVPCEAVVAAGDPADTAVETARTTGCDLIVTPYETDEEGLLSGHVRRVFRGPTDSVAFRSATDADEWRRVLVTVSRSGDSAHAMIDFACRLANSTGEVSVCSCIDGEIERRAAESRLANLVETAEGRVETRVARADVTEFIEANAGAYDLIVVGSSGDRSAASRFVSPPTFERLREVDCDVAVVDRGPNY